MKTLVWSAGLLMSTRRLTYDDQGHQTTNLNRPTCRHSSFITSLDLEKLSFFTAESLVDSLHVLVGVLIKFFFCTIKIISRNIAVFLGCLERLPCITSDISNGDSAVFSHIFRHFHIVAPAFFGERWKIEANDDTIVVRCDSQIAFPNRFLDCG